MRLSEEHGFIQCEALGAIFRGSALAMQGYVKDSIEQIQHGLAIWQGIGANTGLPYFFAALAEAYEEAGKIEEGLDALARAFEEFTEHGERPYEAGLHWIKGKLLLAQSECNQSEAEACFRQAIAVARRQNAKALELRTTVSLSRLLQKQGNKEEARDVLAEIYNWFTEGFDTVEFQEAKALVEGLS